MIKTDGPKHNNGLINLQSIFEILFPIFVVNYGRNKIGALSKR